VGGEEAAFRRLREEALRIHVGVDLEGLLELSRTTADSRFDAATEGVARRAPWTLHGDPSGRLR